MSSTETQTQTYTHIELRSAQGPTFRQVSTAPPRPATEDEIPVIDLGPINGNLEARKGLAAKIRAAAENTGFFYIKNHGISEELIQDALSQAKRFFDQPASQKEKLSSQKYDHTVGYSGVGWAQANRTESKDRKETFGIEYDPRLDPRGNPEMTGSDTSYYALHDSIWENVSHLQGFRDVTIAFWQRRLELARKLVQIFALALDLPETYFDDITTHPGADGLYIHYPGTPDADKVTDFDVGIGSHTDIQCFTLLWQDMSGGLQVLSASGEWLNAHPIPGTIVVNIADFLSRLSNNRFKSTVHRVYNRQKTSRYSMPFFFGFNPDSTCAVVPTCVDDEHPPLYDPISCGKWHRTRLAMSRDPKVVMR